MWVQLIIRGGPWTIFTWAIALMAMATHRGIIPITVTIPPGITHAITTPMAIIGDDMGVTANPITPVGEVTMVIAGVKIMTAMQIMTVRTPLTAETVEVRMKMATKKPAIVAMKMAGVATKLRP